MPDETVVAENDDVIAMMAGIVSAYVANNHVQAGELPSLIASVHAALSRLGGEDPAASPEHEKLTPAQIRKSITPDAIISFEDGKGYKTMRRHLTLRGLTAEAYRAKWGLPADYPMVTESYSAKRSELAKSLGLGQLRRKPDARKLDVIDAFSEEPKTVSRSRKEAEPD
ncbi:MucR family transcriptional regulator [Methylobacterium sp. J-092]|uniref:MucR family transcriptional regulator n=1 Tax=Methylobacterium sp. J-092 TaxID=2836667 RepID=UPI001FB976A7|nr:MucR family transcriptional regulator [Methylobacterium sp. J-092]MCJ2005541.1 MucR family transcriptional regulator [Methylobacterium sp. J-092]